MLVKSMIGKVEVIDRQDDNIVITYSDENFNFSYSSNKIQSIIGTINYLKLSHNIDKKDILIECGSVKYNGKTFYKKFKDCIDL